MPAITPAAIAQVRAIRRTQKAGLLRRWAQIKAGNTPGWPSGKALEYLVMRAFEIEGASVEYPFEVKDGAKVLEQIDGIVFFNHIVCIFECKDQSHPLAYDPIATLRQQLARRPSSVMGACVSMSGFTDNSRALTVRTAPQNILLWEADEIEYALQRARMTDALVAKHRHCVTRAMPDLNVKAAQI